MIKRILRWCRVSLASDDSQSFVVRQVEYLGKVSDATVWLPYGVHANVPVDALAILATLGGTDEVKVALPGSPQQRPRLSVSGEVAFYHPGTGSKLHFKSSGDVHVEAGATTIVLSRDGDVTITPAAKATVAGDLDVTGDLTVTGATALSATVTSNGKDISDTHTHVGSATAPDGPVSDRSRARTRRWSRGP